MYTKNLIPWESMTLIIMIIVIISGGGNLESYKCHFGEVSL